MKDFCVLGSGISGSTIAKLLSKKYSVEVFDKAKGIGGRSSNRRFKNNLSFDHGAQYISPKDTKFKRFLFSLKKTRIIKEWKGSHINLTLKKKNYLKKYIGYKKNNDISKFLLKGLKVNLSSSIKSIEFKSNYWTVHLTDKKRVYFKNLILTCPFPQARFLAKKYLSKKILNLKVNMLPNITVMVVYKNCKNIPVSSFRYSDQILSWAANENSKNRFKSNYLLWTLQSSEKWAKKNINKFKKNKKKTTLTIVKRFEKLTGFKNKNLFFSNIHGWKYSFNYNKTNLKSFWSKKYNLGVCGDWFLGHKIEHSWLSANNLFKKIDKKKPALKKRV